METKLGLLLWSQATSWEDFEAAARRVDELGYDQLWVWDHLYAIFGDPYQPIFEGYTALAAWARVTSRAKLGLLVGANTFRNPAVVAKMLTTIDHISGGRAIAGLGGAWHELEHKAAGLDFGSGFGQRLDWLDEAVGAVRAMLDGASVTSAPGGHYAFDDFRLLPVPVQAHLPILIGGAGERKTLRTVARYADQWNAMGSAEFLRHKGPKVVELIGGTDQSVCPCAKSIGGTDHPAAPSPHSTRQRGRVPNRYARSTIGTTSLIQRTNVSSSYGAAHSPRKRWKPSGVSSSMRSATMSGVPTQNVSSSRTADIGVLLCAIWASQTRRASASVERMMGLQPAVNSMVPGSRPTSSQ